MPGRRVPPCNWSTDSSLGVFAWRHSRRLHELIADNIADTQRVPFNYKPDVALQHYLLTSIEFTEAESFEVRYSAETLILSVRLLTL